MVSATSPSSGKKKTMAAHEKFQITETERLRNSLFEEKLLRLKTEMTLIMRDRSDFQRELYAKYTENGTYNIVGPIVDGAGTRERVVVAGQADPS